MIRWNSSVAKILWSVDTCWKEISDLRSCLFQVLRVWVWNDETLLKPFENYTLVSWILLFLTLFFYRRRCRNKVIKNTSSTYNRLLFLNFYNRTHDTHTLICYSKNSNIFQTKLDSLLMPFNAKKNFVRPNITQIL